MKNVLLIPMLYIVISCGDSNATTKEDSVNQMKLLTSSPYFKSFLGSEDFKNANFSIIKDDLVAWFDICNSFIYQENPDVKRMATLFIQENLFGYSRVVDNGNFYKIVKNSVDFPALDNGINPTFIQMATATTTQKNIYKEDYSKFQKSYGQEMNQWTKDPKPKNIKEAAVCGFTDIIFGLYNYESVMDHEVISWKSAKKMKSNVSSRARAKVTSLLQNN